MSAFGKLYSRIPETWRPAVMAALSALAGLASAVLFSYLLYRFGLPSKPFIYVSF